MVSTEIADLNWVILGLGVYFPLVNALSQKKAMHRGTRKPCELGVSRYPAHLIDLNEYSVTLPGTNKSNKISEMDLNQILLNSMKNGWGKQAYMKGFDFETIT